MGFLSRSTEIRPTLCQSIHNPPPIYKKYPRELDHPAPQSCVENYVSPIKSLSIWRITELRKSCTSYTAILASSYLRDRSKLTSDVTILRPFLCAKDRSLQAIYLITIACNAIDDAKRTEWAMLRNLSTNIPTDYYHVNNIRIHNTGREANRGTTGQRVVLCERISRRYGIKFVHTTPRF